jgi:predicted AlkP superfamily phosphohydrolase/phosphomutase
LISGFVALDLEKAVYPKDVCQKLKAMGYRLDVKAKLAAEEPDAFFVDVFEVFSKRTEAIEYFFEHENWQIFVGTITATDRLHHYFYAQALEDGPYHQQMLAFYRKLDDFIWGMFRRAKDRGALFLTCSDHGFTPIKSEVYINRWLIDQGYLELENGKEGLSGITERSSAFCLDPARIYIHSRDKYPKGCVSSSEYEAVRNKLAEQLANFSYNGEKIVKRVYFGDDIFSGPFSDLGPDIYLLPHYGFDLKGAVNRPEVFGKTHFAGMHTYDDAHLFISPGRSIESPRIEEVAHLITSYMES